MTLKPISGIRKHSYASVEHKGKSYDLIFGHPKHMLIDEKISWEAKGVLSFFTFIEGDIEVPDHIIEELIKSDYFVEVAE
jgi:hypothetical protein